MSNELTALREQLETTLQGAGLAAYATLPERWTPPGVFVGPDLPYLDFEGATFGGVLVHHQLTLVTAAGTNDTQAEALDDLILTVLGLDLGDYQVQTVDQPGRVTLNGQSYLGVAVHLTPIEIRL